MNINKLSTDKHPNEVRPFKRSLNAFITIWRGIIPEEAAVSTAMNKKGPQIFNVVEILNTSYIEQLSKHKETS